ncbi:LysR family transcriptional regulator [Vibrio hannami]|uniref:LysR family transcriptional regulator n=1 Tax=Vibrio hannami TaxID=2717094 RepID=UPI00240FE1A0|nr:LysR family transcriptional regulator [Vibrio hannami]MDG3086060.1 LysR family transcriptional regulator [Vibrio hannami]
MSINLDYLSAFVEVYESGSFAQAASSSKRHASTFSRKISALEDDLGFELFVRHSRSLEPTVQAKALYDHAKGFLTEANLFEGKVDSIYQGHPGETIIMIDTAVVGLGVMDAIGDLMKEMPALKVTLKTGDTESVRDALSKNKADMAFALSTFSMPADINSFRFMDFEFVRVATENYLKQHNYQPGKPITPSTVRGMTQVIMSPLRRLGVESQVYSHRIVNADSFHIALALAKQGAGWCNVPKRLLTDEVESGSLTFFEVEDDFRLNWSVELMWPTEKVYDPIRERIIDKLQ